MGVAFFRGVCLEGQPDGHDFPLERPPRSRPGSSKPGLPIAQEGVGKRGCTGCPRALSFLPGQLHRDGDGPIQAVHSARAAVGHRPAVGTGFYLQSPRWKRVCVFHSPAGGALFLPKYLPALEPPQPLSLRAAALSQAISPTSRMLSVVFPLKPLSSQVVIVKTDQIGTGSKQHAF